MPEITPDAIPAQAGRSEGANGALVLPPHIPLPDLPFIGPPLRTPPLEAPDAPLPPVSRKYPRPDYSERFRCIAEACEDTCCSGWGVPVDQGTYEKYRSHPGMKPFVGSLIVLDPNASSTADFARMPLSQDGKCAFLEPSHLCSIQHRLGEEMLPVTCSTYPRAVSSLTGAVEKALNLSCPEAARVTLLDANLLGNALPESIGMERYLNLLWFEYPLRKEDVRLAVREFVLLVLTDRRYPLWQRLYLLAPFGRRLRTLSGSKSIAAWCEANPLHLTHVLEESARSVARGRLLSVLDEIPAQPDQQLQVVTEIMRLRMQEGPVVPRLVECAQEFEQGLGCTAGTEQGILDAYAEGYRTFYRALMDAQPHILENYLINYVFKNHYPFGGPVGQHDGSAASANDTEDAHMLMCVQTALVQTMLIGMAARHREAFDLGHVVKLVQSVSRGFEHNKSLLRRIAQRARERGLNNPRGMALLLKLPD
jgi:lysine-N-methylase